MQVTYIGPLEAVLVPDDSVAGGEIIVEHGQTVDLPSELAKGLLEQGRDSSENDPQHQPQWKRVSADDIDATDGAKKLAAANDVDLAEVKGSGANGRIIQADVAEHIAAAANDDDTAGQADGSNA
jgi:pyruvate/2-oxoglutarate dehydrogenase complex dihydrolipoamide acyltransferase (E2) component